MPHETSVKTVCVTAGVRSTCLQITTHNSYRLSERAQLFAAVICHFFTQDAF